MIVDLFRVGEYNYNDVDKPVRYSEDLLKEIADKYDEIGLKKNHETDEILTKIINITYENGILKGEVPDDIDIDGLGFSPEFIVNLLSEEDEDYYVIDNPVLEAFALTNNPKSGLIQLVNGDDNLSNNLQEIIERKDETITSQQEEIALLKKKIEDITPYVEANKENDKKIKELSSQLEELTASNEEYKNDAEILRKWREEEKSKIIHDIAGDDAPEYLNKLSTEELLDMKEKTIKTEPAKGVSTIEDDVDLKGEKSNIPPEPTSEDYLDDFHSWEESLI